MTGRSVYVQSLKELIAFLELFTGDLTMEGPAEEKEVLP